MARVLVFSCGSRYDVGVVKLPSLVTACNADCACGFHRQFEPVCGSDHKSYFSVCHAGCLDVTGGSYGNCSCIPDGVSTATEGICKQSCVAFPIACVCFGLGMFFVFSSHAPALNIVMRVLPPEHVSMGLSAMQAVWKLFGSFPGPILLGSIFDSHCLYDRTACDGAKSCALYDNKPLSVSYALLGVFPKMIATASYLLALWFYRKSKAHMDTQRLVASRSDGAVMVDGLVSDYSPMGVDDAAGASPLTSEHVSVELSTIRAPPPGDDDTLQSPILSH
jgi:Organic Anion Transporter Polypeptide (OATP) family/Kazal-type serine protease inhibitor domain